jgi:predicted  nucleic acid-binding Zn-ribbon protein
MKKNKEISQPSETDNPSASQRAKEKPKDFATGWHIQSKKNKHKVQAGSSQDHAPSDSNPHSEGQMSNEGQRDEIAHRESRLRNASGNEMEGKVLWLDQNMREMEKFLQERYKSAKQEAILYGEQEIGSSNEIHPTSQGETSSKIDYLKNSIQSRVEECKGQLDHKHEEKPVDSQDLREKLLSQDSSVLDSPVDSQDFRGKSLSQDSSVPDSSIDQSHLSKRAQELDKDACNKKELFFNTLKKCRSITKEIIRLKKERAALKKIYKPLKMKKLKSKIEKYEQKSNELTLQLNTINDEFKVNITEINHMAGQNEVLYGGIREEYDVKKSILKYLEDEIKKIRTQQVNFMGKLEEIKKSQEKINKSKEDKIRQKEESYNEAFISRLERTKSTLNEESLYIDKYIKKYKKEAKLYKNHLQPIIRTAKIDLLTKSNIEEKDRIIKLLKEVCESHKEYGKTRNDIDKKSKSLLDSRVKAIKHEIEGLNKKIEDNINSHGNYNNYDINHFKDQIEIIKYYFNKDNNTIKDDIKDLDSKYKKIQNNMRNIEELKEVHRIAEQELSQCQLDHRFYLMEREQIITDFCLTDEGFRQNKEINIQNPELAQEERNKFLRQMESLGVIIKGIEKEINDQTSTYQETLDNITRLQEAMASPSGIKEIKKLTEKLDESCKHRDKILEELSQIATRKLRFKDEMEMRILKVLEIDKYMRDCRLKEIEDYQLAKSNLEQEIEAKLKIIESQFKTDLRNLQKVYGEKNSELERLGSELEDLEKKMSPETQQQNLQEQFNKQINKIRSQLNTINKELGIDHKSIKDIENELDDYEQKREPLTRQIKDHQDKLKEEKKELDIINAKWLKAIISAEEAHSSLESNIIERTRNSMERRNVHKTAGEIGPISHGLQGDTKNSTSEYLGEVAHPENDYSIIDAYNQSIKLQHEELDKLNQNLINLYERQKLLKRRFTQNKIKIGSIYNYKHKLANKSLEQLAILNSKKEEYTAIKQVFSKLDEEYHDCLQTCEAVGNVIAILNSEISAVKEGQQPLTSPSDEINTKPEQLNGLDSQSHTLRQQNEVSAQEVKDLLAKELAIAEHKKRELEEKIEKSRKELEDKKEQLKLSGSEWIKAGKDSSKARHRIVKALAEKYELRRHLAKVKNNIEAIESNKFYNKIESNKIIKDIQELFEKDNPTVADRSQEESNKPSKSKSILKKTVESQEDQGRQAKQVRSNASQTASERLKDPLQAREEIETAHTDATLHSQEQSSSALASGVDFMTIASLNASRYEQSKARMEAFDDSIIMARSYDEDRKHMLKAKFDAMLRRKDWRIQWITKRHWDGAGE